MLQRRYNVRVVSGTKSAKSVVMDDVKIPGAASQRLRARQLPLLEPGECAGTSPKNDSDVQHRRRRHVDRVIAAWVKPE
jgi:hypothetical protein